MIDFVRFCRDQRIATAPYDHKHNREGWVNVSCPACVHNPGYHLGYNEAGDYFYCWSCGHRRPVEILAKLAVCSRADAFRLLEAYQTPGRPVKGRKRAAKRLKEFGGLPMGTGPLEDRHRRYLAGRGFDPDELAEIWDLRGTGHLGPYKFRIIAPITWRGQIVSYQGRDVTGRSHLKYKACVEADEAWPHKGCLYGLDLIEGDAVVVVEGIADAWRLGVGAVGTFGTSWSGPQARLLAPFERVSILFDFGEPDAQAKAEALGETVAALGGHDVEIVDGLGVGDPGDLPQTEAVSLMRELLG